MTFTEAAVEVLRLVGKPLHYKKITEVAIERDLLSHVGKTPEVTMSSRLATMVKRDRGDAPIIKIKPGVFGLREFTEEQLADLSGDVDELPEVEVEGDEDGEDEAVTRNGSAEPAPLGPSLRRPLPGADVFPEEEDDDEPIFGGEDEDELGDESEADEEGDGEGLAAESAGHAERLSGRRRRKRRRRGAGEESDDLRPSAREGRAARPLRERRAERFEERRFVRRDELAVDLSREPRDGDLLGKDLADAVASVLGQNGARGQSAVRIAEHLVRKGRMMGEPSALVPTIVASVRADMARRRTQGKRPRFRLEGPVILLTDFLLPQDVVRAEQEVNRAAERQRERARRAFLRRVVELPASGLAELIATWLNAEGVVGLHAVRRPGSGGAELHLAGTLRRGIEETRLAVVILRDQRDVGRERVIETRGAMHYYDNASAAWIVTCGNVQGGAREEAASVATGTITLFDGPALAEAMERVSVGLSVQQVAISALDLDLLDSLRGGPLRERQRDVELEPTGERERREGRERQRDGMRARDEEPEIELDEAEEPLLDELEDGGEDSATTAAADEGTQQATGREGGRRRRRRRRRKGRAAGGAESAGPEREEELAGEAEGGEPEEEEPVEAGEEADFEQETYVAYASDLSEDDEVPLDRYLESDYRPVRTRRVEVDEDAEPALDEGEASPAPEDRAAPRHGEDSEDEPEAFGSAPSALVQDGEARDDDDAPRAPSLEAAEPLISGAAPDSEPPPDESERVTPALPESPGSGER